MWIAAGTLAYILFLLICIGQYTIFYLTQNVQVASFSQLLYTLKVSMGGAENTIWQILGGFFSRYWLAVLVSTAVYGFFIWMIRKHRKSLKEQVTDVRLERTLSAVGVSSMAAVLLFSGLFGSTLYEGYNVLGIQKYLDERATVSTLYENYYVPAQEADISFPEKKNIIWIFMESMESTYADRADGGTMDQNLIPNLTRTARENVDFSAEDDSRLNGAYVTNFSSWTIAGMVSQTSGTPLCLDNSEFTRNFDGENAFMPSLTSIGDLLYEQGYRNCLMVGSEAAYGGRANYFSQHGNYEIFDLQTARDEEKIPAGYKEWWGFEDAKLFDYAKEKISQMAKEDGPFNFTMLTADTHFKDGYLCEDCEEIYDEQMENVIHCSDHRVSEFLDWISEQDFADDTVVVLSGDHLNMDGLIPELTDEGYTRRAYFSVVNGPEYTLNKTREYTTLDIAPTVLEAAGARIEGSRIGLGTSLYSDVPTLTEELGFDSFNDQIAYRSNYYENVLLSGTDTRAE